MAAPALVPGEPGAFDCVAVKDPTIVFHDGKWRVFYTAAGEKGYGIGYVAAETLDGLQHASRSELAQLRGEKEPYAAAPQVFFFEPQQTWYLVYQTRDSNYQPVYSTTRDIDDLKSWTPPTALVAKEEKAKWIDFWVICDDATAYLFYTRDHKDVCAMTARIEDFPRGFANPQRVFAPVHEAVHIYKAKGTAQYHMLYEMRLENDVRRFGLAIAEHLLGPWKNVADAYATKEQLEYAPGAERWTEEVSHGEMLRTGVDQRLEYDAAHPQFLIQGMMPSEHVGEYHRLQWRLGIIEGRQ